MDVDIVAAVEPVVAALERLGVTYRIGGSVASSVLGVPRSTLDVDLVCNLRPADVAQFVGVLQADYYADADMVHEAILRKSSFNLVHLASMIKIDVFILKSGEWDHEAFSRSVCKRLDASETSREFDLTTAEDIVLHKLEWYRAGGGTSDRQWNDAVGVLALQRDALDWVYLRRWARALGLDDLLERAAAEAAKI